VGRTKSAIKPARMRSEVHKFGDRCRDRFTIKSWCLRIRDSATRERTPPGPSKAGQGSHEMDTKNDQIAHRRIVAGREILRKYGRSNNSPATGTGPCCQLREKRIKSSISCTCRLARKYESQLGLAQSAAYRIG